MPNNSQKHEAIHNGSLCKHRLLYTTVKSTSKQHNFAYPWKFHFYVQMQNSEGIGELMPPWNIKLVALEIFDSASMNLS